MAKPELPLGCITIIYNKVLNKKFSFPEEQLKDAEKDYREICRMDKVTGTFKDLAAIDEMIKSLRKNQHLAAGNHAKRVHEAIKSLKTTTVPKPTGYAQIHGTSNKTAQSAGHKEGPPDEPPPDYNGAEENDQMPNKQDKGQSSHPDQPKTATYTRPVKEKMKEKLQNQQVVDQMEKSKDASERLRKDNPNLTDLGDANRPTKLAEKHSELYDNEWTDAFEELQKKYRLDDREAVKCLLEIMTESYKRNCSESKSQFEVVEKEIKRIMTGPHGSADIQNTGERKSIKGDTSALKQYLKSLAILSNQRLQKTFEEKYLPEILRRHKCRDQRDLPILLRFTRKCVELTWLMCVQEPPIVLDSLEGYDKFDTNCYKAFTKQGKTVAYYVWPALLLHDGGPLLAKGVAQGK